MGTTGLSGTELFFEVTVLLQRKQEGGELWTDGAGKGHAVRVQALASRTSMEPFPVPADFGSLPLYKKRSVDFRRIIFKPPAEVQQVYMVMSGAMGEMISKNPLNTAVICTATAGSAVVLEVSAFPSLS